MRSRTAMWFECKVRYDKLMEDGMQKKVTEAYTLDAMSYTEAEKRITEEMSKCISGEFEVADIKKAPYKEIFFDNEDVNADRYYRAKLSFITVDEKTEKEKRSNVTYLVHAASFSKAMKNLQDVMNGTMIDYVIVGINETQLLDVYEFGSDKDSETEDEE